MTSKRISVLAVAVCVLASACGDADPVELPGTSSVRGPGAWRYERGVTFVALADGAPLAAPFAFRTDPQGAVHRREARAWLARGEAWDRFIDETWAASPAAGVWRVLPRPELRIGAGSAGGIEWLGFRSGDRRLRLELTDADAGWYGAERERFRIVPGTLTLGSERVAGLVVEEMRVSRNPAADGSEIVYDRLILLDSDGVALYLLHERAASGEPGTVWVLASGDEQANHDAQVEWVQVRTMDEARRDIPLHWSFSAPESGVSGEVTAIGYDTMFGQGRAGRREIEVRYTVEGWLERDGRRVEVFGVVRHEQR